ncbi:MAG: hypothetical protein VX589_01760 [Myxococcota bacterium]|nr:hypothetical protein [Myxococcota bacterium]
MASLTVVNAAAQSLTQSGMARRTAWLPRGCWVVCAITANDAPDDARHELASSLDAGTGSIFSQSSKKF